MVVVAQDECGVVRMSAGEHDSMYGSCSLR